MKLRLTLLVFCLLCIGIFSHAQAKKKEPKPTVENGPDAIPVIVHSPKRQHRKMPPPPPPVLGANGKPLPPPKVEVVHFKAPKIRPADKNGNPLPPPKVELKHFKAPPPPPKPANEKGTEPIKPDAPPAANERA